MRESGELPAGWVWASLGELLTSIETGKSFKCDERPPRVDEVGVIKVSAVTWGEYQEQESKTCTDPDRINPTLFVRPGDFLFSRANTIELVGACVIARQVGLSAMLSDKILRFCFALDSMKPWVLHFLRSKAGRQQIESLSSGNQESMRNIGQERIGQIRLPLPPTAEQTRIVAKLDELLSGLDAGVAELKAAQRKLQRYRQSLLKAAVEGALTADWRRAHPPTETGADLLARILRDRRSRWEHQQLARYTAQQKPPPKGWQDKYPEPQAPKTTDLPELPDGWVWATLDQLCQVIRNGASNTPNRDGVGLPILRINAVRPMLVDLTEFRHLDMNENDVADCVLQNGDLLMTRYNGSVDLLGVVGLVRGLTRLTLHPDKLIKLKPVVAEVGDWLEIAANVGISRRHIVDRVKTTAGQTGISGEDVKKTPVPLPPIAEQVRVSELVGYGLAEIGRQSDVLEHCLRQSAAQRQNLLRAAFRGELVPQDPADESASLLLARLHAERAADQSGKGQRKRKG